MNFKKGKRVVEAANEFAPILRDFFKEREMSMAETIEATFWALYRVIEPKRQKVLEEMERRKGPLGTLD